MSLEIPFFIQRMKTPCRTDSGVSLGTFSLLTPSPKGFKESPQQRLWGMKTLMKVTLIVWSEICGDSFLKECFRNLLLNITLRLVIYKNALPPT